MHGPRFLKAIGFSSHKTSSQYDKLRHPWVGDGNLGTYWVIAV
jgi:hypothetical protein